jgi:hypothetical protein
MSNKAVTFELRPPTINPSLWDSSSNSSISSVDGVTITDFDISANATDFYASISSSASNIGSLMIGHFTDPSFIGCLLADINTAGSTAFKTLGNNYIEQITNAIDTFQSDISTNLESGALNETQYLLSRGDVFVLTMIFLYGPTQASIRKHIAIYLN